MLSGALFTEDYLREGVRSHPGHAACLAAAPAVGDWLKGHVSTS